MFVLRHYWRITYFISTQISMLSTTLRVDNQQIKYHQDHLTYFLPFINLFTFETFLIACSSSFELNSQRLFYLPG